MAGIGLLTAADLEAIRRDVRAMREELRDAVAERDSKDDFASHLHVAIRESIVNQQAEDKSSACWANGHLPRAKSSERQAAQGKSSVYQFSVWSGWPGADPMEQGEDVGIQRYRFALDGRHDADA